MKKLALSFIIALLPTFALACPDWQGDPHYGSVTLPDAFKKGAKEHIISVQAGGSVDLSQCTSMPGIGYVSRNPDYDVHWEGNTSNIAFAARSDTDTVLLVNAPDGSWHFSDDEHGHHPIVYIQNPQRGLYDIWVGTFSSGGLADADILVIAE
jgi:hypothetical protein